MPLNKWNALLLAALCVAGCRVGDSYLETRTTPERAEYGGQAIDVPPAPVKPASAPAERGEPIVVDQVTGTWTFTVPRTVTQVERRSADYHQYSLYNGQPQPTDRPFMIITVSRDRASIAEKEPATYKVSNKREYVINGNIAQEWTGLTDAGAGFCEMIVRRPGTPGRTGDVCHAMALARNEEEQKLALGMLGSITWKASR